MNVYIIKHLSSGRTYVGKANNVAKRWAGHLKCARQGKGSYLHAAIRKYGSDQFFIATSFSFNSEEAAYAAEVVWIKALQSNTPGGGFNLDSGGVGNKKASVLTRYRQSIAKLGTKRSPETIKKIGEASGGRLHSEETKSRMSEIAKNRTPEHLARIVKSNTGKTRSEDTCKRISEAKMGTVISPEQRLKQSLATKGRPGKIPSLETRAKMSASGKARAPISDETRAKLADSLRKFWAQRRQISDGKDS